MEVACCYGTAKKKSAHPFRDARISLDVVLTVAELVHLILSYGVRTLQELRIGVVVFLTEDLVLLFLPHAINVMRGIVISHGSETQL